MLVLIGEENSKRTLYMKKAADSLNVPLQVCRWKELQSTFDLGQLKGAVVKADPPSFQTVHLCRMQTQLEEYRRALMRLMQAECRFLNSPENICRLLDKRETKRYLQERGIPVTRMFPGELKTAGQLIETMKQRRCYSVFVKPRFFSGAAGVAAFRLHPIRGTMRLYTSCRREGKQLINTKKLFYMDNQQEIIFLLNQLLSLDCVVERWHPKADFGGKSYDLRVVFQFGHIAHIVVRQSKGPITNLHLNNQALDIRQLGLTKTAIEEIAAVCEQACALFPGLSMAGLDILLEKDTRQPRIIEMNGQGDLIYQDIYHENRIYREQVAELCRKSI